MYNTMSTRSIGMIPQESKVTSGLDLAETYWKRL